MERLCQNNIIMHSEACKGHNSQLQVHSLILILTHKSVPWATSVLSEQPKPMAHKTTAPLNKLNCTNSVDFRKRHDRFGPFPGAKVTPNYLDVKIEVFKRRIVEGIPQNRVPYDIVRMHSFMIYTELIQFKIIFDIKAPLVRVIPLISKLKPGEITSRSNTRIIWPLVPYNSKDCSKNNFKSFTLTWETRAGKNPFEPLVFNRLTSIIGKTSNFFSNEKGIKNGSCRTSRDSIPKKFWST